MADLAVHPHLRRIEVDTPNGPVAYPAPAAIVVDQVTALRRRAGDRRPPRRRRQTHPHRDKIAMTAATAPATLDLDHLQAMDRPHRRENRCRHRASGARPARHLVHGDRRPETGRRRTLHRALVPGAAGLSDVATRSGRPPDPRRLPAAGAAAAPDVGRRRTGIFRSLARRRRDEAQLAHLGRDHEDRQHRRAVLRLRPARGYDAARHRDPRAAGHRLSRHDDSRQPRRPNRRRRRRPQNIAKATWRTRCCCSAIRR